MQYQIHIIDTKTTLIHYDIQGTIVWDERDTILCSMENDAEYDAEDDVEDDDVEIALDGGGKEKSETESSNIHVNPKNSRDTYKVFEELYGISKKYTEQKAQGFNSKNEYQIRIHFDNFYVPDLLTNTLNPFIVFQNKKKFNSSRLLSLIGQPYTFPDYSNIINNKFISTKRLLKIQVPLKLEIERLKRFRKETQKTQNRKIYTHCPSDLQHVVLKYNTNSVYAYDYVSIDEYPFVFEPKDHEFRIRGSELFCRYLTVDDLTTFVKFYNKKLM
jgi:hypothetical protein